jgi:hypothetical protein
MGVMNLYVDVMNVGQSVVNVSKKKGGQCMARQKGICVLDTEIDGFKYSARITRHGQQQAEKRGVPISAIKRTMECLGKERMKDLQGIGSAVAVINKTDEVSLVLEFEGNKAMIITVLGSVADFTKSGTLVCIL